RLVEMRRAALPLAERRKRGALADQRRGSVQWAVLPRELPSRRLVNKDGPMQRGVIAAFALPPKRVAESDLGPGPIERHPLARERLQRPFVGGDRLLQRGVVTALVALTIECAGLALQKTARLLGMPRRHQARGLAEMLRGIEVAQFGHGDIAPHALRVGRPQQPLVGRSQRLLRELLRLTRGRDLDLLGLAQELIGLLQMAVG